VEPEFLGRGTDKTLFEHVKEQCRKRGVNKLYIQAAPNAEVFYAKVGAVLFGKTPPMSIKGRHLPQFIYDLNET